MKHGIGSAALIAACGMLCGCAALQQGFLESGGPAGGDSPVNMLALSVNPALSPDDAGAAAENTADLAMVQRFVEAFAYNIPIDFPRRLEEHGVQARDPGRGVPLLRIHASAYRQDCHHGQTCDTEVRVDGALLDSGGARIWWFSDWLTPDQMDRRGYDAFYKRLLGRMVKDQVIAPD